MKARKSHHGYQRAEMAEGAGTCTDLGKGNLIDFYTSIHVTWQNVRRTSSSVVMLGQLLLVFNVPSLHSVFIC